MLPRKELKGLFPPNNLPDSKNKKANGNGINCDTAQAFIVRTKHTLGSGLNVNYLNLHSNNDKYIISTPKKKRKLKSLTNFLKSQG